MFAKQNLSPHRRLRFLFPFFFAGSSVLCLPPSGRADALEEATRSLARKVAAAPRVLQQLHLEWRNQSSLPELHSASLRNAFEQELRSKGIVLEDSKDSPGAVLLTITETATDIRLVAWITASQLPRVRIVSIPRGAVANLTFAAPTPTPTLDKTLLFQQSEPVLDLKLLDSPGDQQNRMAVLGLSVVSVYQAKDNGWVFKRAYPITGSQLLPRDPRAQLMGLDLKSTDNLMVSLSGLACEPAAGGREDNGRFDCHSPNNPESEELGLFVPSAGPILVDAGMRLDPKKNFLTGELFGESGWRRKIAPFYSASFLLSKDSHTIESSIHAGVDGWARLYDDATKEVAAYPGWGSELTTVQGDCDSIWRVLSSTTGDWTEPDTIIAYEIVDRKAVPVGNRVDMPGPVLALGPEQIPAFGDPKGRRRGAVAIVRNLTTGNYEAYRISLSCNH